MTVCTETSVYEEIGISRQLGIVRITTHAFLFWTKRMFVDHWKGVKPAIWDG